MRIKQLYIHNIASMEEAFIDFDAEPLKSSDLFLISGKIGAGKSTILDSICLALYGTTPRINMGLRDKIEVNDDNLSGRDPRQLMRQNTGEASVRLCFDGTDGNSYEAEWQVQRGLRKKATSTLSMDVWTLRNLTTGEVLSGSTSKDKGVREAVQKAVGLDFDQFCRTTMLAQGEFTKFLKSDEKEKAAILEKITGTGVYSKIGVKIFETTKEKREALKSETEKLNGIQLLTAEEIEAKKERKTEIESSNAELVKAWERALEARRDLKDFNDSQEEIARFQNEISGKLKAQFMSGLKGLLGLEKQAQTIAGQQQQLWAKIESQKDKASVFEQSQAILQLLRTIYRCQQDLEKKTQEKPKLDTDLLSAQKACEVQNATCDKVKKAYVAKEAEVKADEERLKSLALPQLRTQKEALNTSIHELEKLLTRWEGLKTQADRLKAREQQNKELQVRIEELVKQVPLKQDALKTAQELLSSLETLKNLSAKTVDQWAKQIRTTLKEGCVCPVCQQTIQQALPMESELERAYQENLKKFEDQNKVVVDLQNQLNQLNANIQAQNQQFAQNEGTCQKEALELQQEEKRFLTDASKYGILAVPGANETLSKLKQDKEDQSYQLGLRVTEAERYESLLQEKKRQLETLSEQEKTALKAKSQADQVLINAQNAIKNYETAIDGYNKSIKESGKEVDNILGDGLSWPLDWHVDLIGFGNLLKTEAKQYLDDQEALKSSEIRLKETDRMLGNLKEIQRKVLLLQPDWNMVAADEPMMHEGIEEEWNELYTALTTAQQLKAAAEKKKLQAERQLEAFKAKHSLDDLDKQVADAEAKINALKEEMASIAQSLEKDAGQRKDKEALQQRVVLLEEEYARWKRLCDYFGNADGSLFQKIAQSFILVNLLQSANSYLKTLHPRYSLEVVPGTLHISLADAYQGYATRLVSTLSGGESFLVSLALALALADIGQNLAVDTLFIDEGFGSLSGQELNNAINTLRSLHRANGRRVGIISHVEAVKESIPVQIQVVQEGNRSSSVVRI